LLQNISKYLYLAQVK